MHKSCFLFLLTAEHAHYFLPGYKSKVSFIRYCSWKKSFLHEESRYGVHKVCKEKKWQHVCGHLGEQMLKTIEM